MDEGYIKFNCNWIKAAPCSSLKIEEINSWRDRLYNYGLIGAYANGIGFGNISIRSDNNTFIITGSATGILEKLNENHYVKVNEYDFSQNSLTCMGPIKASSESLTHAVIYESSPETQAVIHIHNLNMWEKYIHKEPTTRSNVSYGTPEMAHEIKRLFKETDIALKKFIVMAGHEEGIIVFGSSLDEAGKVLIDH
jgi:ribulose-5-phosphate 4-epimerase/fuculose-1-phosphate aldolase